MSSKSLHNVDLINMKLEQLTALLSVSTCEDFAEYNNKIKIGYLWACANLADEIKAAFQSLDDNGKVNV